MGTRNWRVAVVGAGPAGLYGTEALVKRGAAVDIFERGFAPFGLVRYGVAPDHQKIKKTQIVFERILERPEVRLFANVEVGKDLHVRDLLDEYDQVLITMGSPGARSLNIPGEGLIGSVSATELVGWYNGHPDFIHAPPLLTHPRAVVVGMGNVAIDVARILLRDPDELASTDITEAALRTLRQNPVREVVLLARRGPNQAAFDDKEVRELASLRDVGVGTAGYVSRRPTKKSEFIASFPRAEDLTEERRVVLHFCASPKEILGQQRVEAIRIERNNLVESAARMRAVGTGEYSVIDAGLVVRAIGYQGCALPGVPFNEDTGTIPHELGRVHADPGGDVVPGLYVAGWIKRGPTGLIGTNRGCAVETVERMEEDLDQVGPTRDPEAIERLLTERRIRWISKADWKKLDRFELELGRRQGKVREKVLGLGRALEVIEAKEDQVRSDVRASGPGEDLKAAETR